MKRKAISADAIKTTIFFIVVFALSFAILYLLNFVPNELKDQNIKSEPKKEVATTTPKKQAEYPTRVYIPKVGIDSIVQNPTTTNVYQLDELLLNGVVRYPGSGLAGEGNMFLFGHSTGLKLVNNQAFKAFNNLKNLVAGDMISIYSDTSLYTYRVRTVKLVTAENALVSFSQDKNMLTLSTCNTFGQKEERYVVEADFVRSSAL